MTTKVGIYRDFNARFFRPAPRDLAGWLAGELEVRERRGAETAGSWLLERLEYGSDPCCLHSGTESADARLSVVRLLGVRRSPSQASSGLAFFWLAVEGPNPIRRLPSGSGRYPT